MISLKEFRHKDKSLADMLPYAAMVENGVVLCKDGSLLAGWRYSGRDTASSTPEELAAISARVSVALKDIGTGWALYVNATRKRAQSYPQAERSVFPDAVTQMIEAERRNQFVNHGGFATEHTLIVSYRPDNKSDKLTKVAYARNATTLQHNELEKNLTYFTTTLAELDDALSTVLHMERLADRIEYTEDGTSITYSELLSLLKECVTTNPAKVILPDCPMYLDALISSADLIGGINPKVGGQHLGILSLDGLPVQSWPTMLAKLDQLPLSFRFSTRFILLDQTDAISEIDKYRKTWNQLKFRFMDAMFNNPNARMNRDAAIMSEDAEQAATDVQGGIVGSGFYTATIILNDSDAENIEEGLRILRRTLQPIGFGCRVETVNALEAWFGSHPGNTFANVRRPLINTLNLADFLPLSSIWAGRDENPCPFYPPESPPLMFCTTDGYTPFRLNLHVGDLGHTLIFGPTSTGKSTLLGTLAAQFRRYPRAAIYAFDKGMSMYPLCKGADGTHYEIAGDNSSLAFCPLEHIDTDADKSWAADWLASCCTMQGLEVMPEHRSAIHDALSLLQEKPASLRSLTDFVHTVQNTAIKDAMKHYTISGAMGRLLDAKQDNLGFNSFTVFEIEELMNLGDKNLIPVLLYIFRQIEKSMNGQPTLLILDEAWIMLGHPVFREKIREWLKVLRKANCAVVIATQSLSDAKGSGILDVLAESCPTKIFLPNVTAQQDTQRNLYLGLGLNSKQIEIVASATPKREYYVTSPEGNRLISLALGKTALAFVGASDKESIARIKKLESEHGTNWPSEWMKERM
ncbi:conjugal transfer protein TrbE [Halodesulfovibrio sp.]|jgi:type IV secretion system protein VirB4|uniref:VirB4 family type IV secretion/conjugal transfer ATPase n=1 Tax=Halodesulfovibrio sp. TaxID=1912772 RepID=UPI0025E9EC7B|nr:conjugal transfer protein TrbE [Halodesulfovibrio sp.]MCT4533748.1 conjugal transfer protein TrbE [Halodesulfovibrio sp.]